MNVTSVSTLGKYLKTGIPLVSKRITVDGDAIARRRTSKRPSARCTAMSSKPCGRHQAGCGARQDHLWRPDDGRRCEPSADFPGAQAEQRPAFVQPQNRRSAGPAAPASAVGAASRPAPWGSNRSRSVECFNRKDAEALRRHSVDLCVSCGSCTYVCPAKRPVSQTVTLAKGWYLNELRKGREVTMDQTLLVTASPHIRDTSTTRGLMGNVLIALVPCIVASGPESSATARW